METAQIRKWLKEKLAAESSITALVGTRIYPVKIPQQPTYPAIAYYTSIVNATIMKEAGLLDLVTVQFNIVGPELAPLERIESALRTVLDNAEGVQDGFRVQEARFQSSKDAMEERMEYPIIEVTYQFRMYRA